MHVDMLNILQTLLLPLVLGGLLVGGLLVGGLLLWRIVQKTAPPRTRTTPPAAAPAPATRRAQADTPATAEAWAPAQVAPAKPPTTAKPPAPAVTAAAPAAPELPLRADLLLVDDSAVVRAKLRRLFEPAGYRIVLAQDGEAALALLKTGRYALLITDLEMPRLDGMGLIRAALALPACAGMPILAITGHDDLQTQLNRLDAVAGIHRKPWVDDDLLGHVQALVAPTLQPAESALEV